MWTTRTLSSPDLRTPLATASTLPQPVLLLTHHHTAAAVRNFRPALRAAHTLVTTHTPDTPAPPPPAHPRHHHISPDPSNAELTTLIATLTTPAT